jgi:type IV pilus assembly protein PilA
MTYDTGERRPVLERMRHILNRKGFTLIELMVVVAILAILSAVALLQFKNYHRKSYNTAAVSDIRNMESLLQGYYADNKRYP